MPNTVLGATTKTIFLKGPESHKLHQQFEVETAEAVLEGQPVILTATGTIKVAVAGELNKNVIGFTIHDGLAGELVTVAMKAYTIVWAQSGAALVTGPVQYSGMNATDGDYTEWAAAADVDHEDVIGWALDAAAGADELIRVALGN